MGRSAISAHEEALITIPRKAHERDEVRVTEHAQDADLATWNSDFRVLIKDGKSRGRLDSRSSRKPKDPKTHPKAMTCLRICCGGAWSSDCLPFVSEVQELRLQGVPRRRETLPARVRPAQGLKKTEGLGVLGTRVLL